MGFSDFEGIPYLYDTNGSSKHTYVAKLKKINLAIRRVDNENGSDTRRS